MYCNNCDIKNSEGANYCSRCGARLTVPESPDSGTAPLSPVKNNVSAFEMEIFRKKLRQSV